MTPLRQRSHRRADAIEVRGFHYRHAAAAQSRRADALL